jgi:serine/threonine-protein kinase SRPK3
MEVWRYIGIQISHLEPTLLVEMFHSLCLWLTCADISGRNVAFASKRLSQLTEEGLFEVLGPPETEKLARRDGKPLDKGVPGQLIKATGWDNWIDEDDEDIRIFDLGEAFLKGAEPEKLPQPSHLKVPETIFMDSCDSRHDLWRTGIMVRTPSLKP